MAKGVEVRGRSIRVVFFYEKEKCKESLKIKPTEQNVEYAESLVNTINHEIRLGIFDYKKYFPNSRRFDSGMLKTWIDRWLKGVKHEVAPSTYDSYAGWANRHVKKKWGALAPEEIATSEVKQWITNDLKSLSTKSVKDIVSVMRQVFTLYRQETGSNADPTVGLSFKLPDRTEPETFTLEEIQKITDTVPHGLRYSEYNLAIFCLWTGCRPSEAFALSWENVDLDREEVSFAWSVVRGVYKATKTKGSNRTVDLLQPAVKALKAQQIRTGGIPEIEVELLERDNRTINKKKFKPVFLNTSTGRPFTDSKAYSRAFWKMHLKKAKVPFKGFGQCRHTFATNMLSRQMDVSWICDQLGHDSEKMLRERYAKMIKDYRAQNPADVANAMFSFDDDVNKVNLSPSSCPQCKRKALENLGVNSQGKLLKSCRACGWSGVLS